MDKRIYEVGVGVRVRVGLMVGVVVVEVGVGLTTEAVGFGDGVEVASSNILPPVVTTTSNSLSLSSSVDSINILAKVDLRVSFISSASALNPSLYATVVFV